MQDDVKLLKALADETRLRILNLLCHGELCVCDIMRVLHTAQSKTSRHLAHLKNAGIVEDRREGQWMHYSLSKPHSTLHKQVLQWLKKTGTQTGTRNSTGKTPMAVRDLKVLKKLRQGRQLNPCCTK